MNQRTLATRTTARRRFAPLLGVAIVAVLFGALALGCYDNNTGATSIGGSINFKLPAFPETGPHAVVVFSEMNYQPSYRIQEGPRILPPVDSVPTTGRETVLSSAAEYADLEMPESVANDPDRVAKGQRLAQVNCQACHGAGLRGDGPVVQFLGGKGPVPADLIGGAASSATDGQVFAWVSYGGQAGLATAMLDLPTPSWMPQFAYLLTEEERWEVVAYLRSAQGR